MAAEKIKMFFEKLNENEELLNDELENVSGGGSNVQLTYINKSMNKDLPKIFVFTKNEVPTFDALKEGGAWKVIEDVGRESSCDFVFPIETEVRASWNGGNCNTILESDIGKSYTASKNSIGIILKR